MGKHLCILLMFVHMGCSESNVRSNEDVKSKLVQNSNQTENMKLSTQEVLEYFDSTLVNNEDILYPKFEKVDGYQYGCSKISLFYEKNSSQFSLIIEVVSFEESGKIFNELFSFGNLTSSKEKLGSAYYKNIYYTNVVEYDTFDRLINDDAEIILESEIRLFNHRNEEIFFSNDINDYQETWLKSGFETQEYVAPDIFFKFLIEVNNSELFFLSEPEIVSNILVNGDLVASTSNWHYEDISNIDRKIIAYPSTTKLFIEVANILSSDDYNQFNFDSSNVHWSNWD